MDLKVLTVSTFKSKKTNKNIEFVVLKVLTVSSSVAGTVKTVFGFTASAVGVFFTLITWIISTVEVICNDIIDKLRTVRFYP
nr:MAG TPA: hypothetical protein [Caudoviricetes sp.]